MTLIFTKTVNGKQIYMNQTTTKIMEKNTIKMMNLSGWTLVKKLG